MGKYVSIQFRYIHKGELETWDELETTSLQGSVFCKSWRLCGVRDTQALGLF